MPQYYYTPPASNRNNEQYRQNFALQQRQTAEKRELRIISCFFGGATVAYVIMQVIASAIMMKYNLMAMYSENPVFQYAFNILFISVLAVAVPFCLAGLINKKRYIYPFIPNKPIKTSRSLAWICFGMGCCIIANFATNYLVTFCKVVLGYQLKPSETTHADSIFACVLEVIGLAIIPAICEELAMRCSALQLYRKYGKGFAVFAVSTIFGLLHGNAIQFVFAFTIGAILAYITIQTDSIVPAVFIHALNNGMSAFQDIVAYAAGEKASENALVIVFLFWLVSGIISAVYLLFKKGFKKTQDSRQYTSVLTTGQKIANFLFPGMVIPFFILILLTAQTIEKI